MIARSYDDLGKECDKIVAVELGVLGYNSMTGTLALPKCERFTMESYNKIFHNKCSAFFNKCGYFYLCNTSFDKVLFKNCECAAFVRSKKIDIEARQGGELFIFYCDKVIVRGKWKTMNLIGCELNVSTISMFRNVEEVYIQDSSIDILVFPKKMKKVQLCNTKTNIFALKECDHLMLKDFDSKIFYCQKVAHDFNNKPRFYENYGNTAFAVDLLNLLNDDDITQKDKIS